MTMTDSTRQQGRNDGPQDRMSISSQDSIHGPEPSGFQAENTPLTVLSTSPSRPSVPVGGSELISGTVETVSAAHTAIHAAQQSAVAEQHAQQAVQQSAMAGQRV